MVLRGIRLAKTYCSNPKRFSLGIWPNVTCINSVSRPVKRKAEYIFATFVSLIQDLLDLLICCVSLISAYCVRFASASFNLFGKMWGSSSLPKHEILLHCSQCFYDVMSCRMQAKR